MRRPVTLLAVFAAAACLAPAAAPAGVTETIQVISITTYSHQEPTNAVSGGYSVDSRDKLVNVARQFGLRSGARVGTDQGRFTYTSAHTASYAGEASLPGGTVTVRGAAFAHNSEVVIRVVGGSGKYKGATGFLMIGLGPAKTRSLNTYELTLPLPSNNSA